jgi:V-type H+-transporting ATPase subunit a
MSLGVLMKAFNAIHFSSKIDFFFEFIPQIVLLLGLFGYMDMLIIIKWLTDYTGRENEAPGIINTMINIPLKGAVIEGEPFFSDRETNMNVSITLLIIAVICVPIMLFPKPLILIAQMGSGHEEEHDQKEFKVVPHNDADGDDDGTKEYQKLDDDNEDAGMEKRPNGAIQNPTVDPHEDNKSNVSEEATEFKKKSAPLNSSGHQSHSGSEIFIHQLIETIEFVLGTISNTASYLRLWALSLAHSQLAEVFFHLVLWSGVEAQNPIMIFIGYLVFGSATFAVLMCMDLMECFLHTLRLHWVEFQNKFYKGTGTLFKPLNFNSLSVTSQGF